MTDHTPPDLADLQSAGPATKRKRRKLERVYAELPRCPECDSTRHRSAGRTVTDDDVFGYRQVKYTECIDCEARFYVEWE